MTGAMVVVAPGSSVQLLIAVLVMLWYLMVVLKTAPYEEDSEDWSSFIACVALTLTCIGGLVLIQDNPSNRTYEDSLLAVILIGINVFCIALDIVIVVVVDCGLGAKCGLCGGGSDDSANQKKNNNNKVMPVRNTNEGGIKKDDDDDVAERAEAAWGQPISQEIKGQVKDWQPPPPPEN